MTMPVTLALQAAALAFALLMTGTSLQPTEQMRVIRTVAPSGPRHLHCRLYFGCAPLQKADARR